MTDKEENRLDTGSTTPGSRIVSVEFDNYTIKVKLGDANEFLGIIEVGGTQDFRSLKQRVESGGTHDVSDFYDLR